VADNPRFTKQRLLVGVGPSPESVKLINAAKRMADDLQSDWYAVYVEHPKMLLLPEAESSRVVDHLRLAEQLGGKSVTLKGRDIAEELVSFAQQQNITRIVVGKPKHSRWRSIFSGSPIDKLVRISGEIDLYVITGEPGEPREPTYHLAPKGPLWPDYGTGFLFFILANALCFLMYPHLDLSNLIMVYLLGVLVTAIECGRGPAVLVSLLSVLAFDFFFVPPRFTFRVDDAQYVVTFIVMFLVALVISHLTTRMRQQADTARLQERQAAAMHGLSGQLASARGVEEILRVALKYLSEIFDGHIVALLPDDEGALKVAAGDLSSVLHKDVVKEMSIAQTVYESGRIAGWGTQTSPTTQILYVALQAADCSLGVLALRPEDPGRFLLPEQLHLLETLAKQVALALEVEHLTAAGRSH
jgi:two-component system sensor histidine kinase KdpD